MRYSKGIMWLDDCRIPFVDESDNNTTRNRYDTIGYGSKMNNGWGSMDDSATKGRFTPNLLVCDDMLNDGVITLSKKGKERQVKNYGSFGGGHTNTDNEYNDKGSSSRYYDLDKWFDKIIDEIQ